MFYAGEIEMAGNCMLEGLAVLAFQPKVATDTLRMLMNFWFWIRPVHNEN